jgi:low molecular weight protein-tyrosine phosphatase
MVNERYRLMFVCSGNTCRSPMAEHVLRSCLADAGLAEAVDVASSGLRAAHPGGPADPRAMAVLAAGGYGSRHAGRQFELDMFSRYDLIVALDTGHQELLREVAPDAASAAKVVLLRSFDPACDGALDVPDPVRGGAADYEQVLLMIEAAAPGIVTAVCGQRA